MGQEIKVRISDYKVSKAPDKLITIGLGSCIGIAIYDKTTGIGGLSHIMLPDSTLFSKNIKVPKFADLAIPAMIKDIVGTNPRSNLVAKIAGGANMFKFSSDEKETVGSRNIVAVEKILKDLNIPILGKDLGGNVGRTMIVDLENFEVSIKKVNGEIKML